MSIYDQVSFNKNEQEQYAEIDRLSNYIGCIVTICYFFFNTIIFSEKSIYFNNWQRHILFLFINIIISIYAFKFLSVFKNNNRTISSFTILDCLRLTFMLLAANLCIIIFAILMPGVNNYQIETLNTNEIETLLQKILIIGVLGPIAEEIQFRGVYLNVLKKFGVSYSVIVSSIIFALLHPGIRFFIALILGIFTSALMLSTKKILWPIIYHSLYNIILLFVEKQRETYVYCLVLSIAIFLILIFCFKCKKTFQIKSICSILSEVKKDKRKYVAFFSSLGMVSLIITFGMPSLLLLFQEILYAFFKG